ncbi:MAG: hypothetical protein PHX61_14790 [Alphaproteobacteria bacterium]|nr:hypothetical protein [Alphaproteobacteria bacterium]
MISFQARLMYSEPCAESQIRILRFAPLEGDALFPHHLPGQYALLTFPGFAARPYSIANLPNGHILEFHIRNGHSGASAYASSSLSIGEVVDISGYGGTCLYNEDCEHSLILVAGGTGLAPMLAIAEAALADNPDRRVSLFHGGRHKEDLYADKLLNGMAEKFPSFLYHPVLSDDQQSGIPSGLVGDIALATLKPNDKVRIYASGPVEMLRRLHESALAAGLSADLIHSDLSEFDKRMAADEGVIA